MESLDKQKVYRIIPPVNNLLDNIEVKGLINDNGRDFVVEKIRKVTEEIRENIQFQSREDATQYIIKKLVEEIEAYRNSGLKKVINATGIVLHTNIGRAPLPIEAINLINQISEGYSNLELDLKTGARGSRYSHIEPIIREITGAEAAMVVNNNAAAVFLTLNTLANNKEVIVSRGQQVEIGGSFRIPDIILRSSARMVEVGTTNKTKLSDYRDAVTEDTSVLLKVHASNYKITGFTEEVKLKDLIDLGKEKNLMVIEDLGSGSLYDLSIIGLPYEPTVQDSVMYGADIVTFSGDKLLGGPQVGIIVGKKVLIERIKKNPLTRMLRCDKLTISALTAVLQLYLNKEKVVNRVPAIRMMALKEEELLDKATELKELIEQAVEDKYKLEIIDDLDEVGGGSLPGVILKGKAVAISTSDIDANKLQEELRGGKTPIVCRIKKDRILLNVRTIERREFKLIVEALKDIR